MDVVIWIMQHLLEQRCDMMGNREYQEKILKEGNYIYFYNKEWKCGGRRFIEWEMLPTSGSLKF